MTLLPSPHDGNADAAAEVVRERCALVPSVAIVLGSGLGAATAAMQEEASFGFDELPGFPAPTVPGHAGRLVLGRIADRRNIVSAIVEKAELFDEVPHLEAGRLRATWLSVLLSEHVPIAVVLDAAGLKSARTLTELIDTLPEIDPHLTRTSLRGEQK